MSFKITSTPASRKVELDLSELGNITTRGIRQAFYQIGVVARQKINRDVLAKPRSGQVYLFKGRRHTASRAGESFANRSGDARRKRGFETRGSSELEFGFRKDGETIYTKILEETGGRPTVGNASKFTQGRAQNIMVNELEKAHDAGFK
jgi:hypothetical protein